MQPEKPVKSKDGFYYFRPPYWMTSPPESLVEHTYAEAVKFPGGIGKTRSDTTAVALAVRGYRPFTVDEHPDPPPLEVPPIEEEDIKEPDVIVPDPPEPEPEEEPEGKKREWVRDKIKKKIIGKKKARKRRR